MKACGDFEEDWTDLAESQAEPTIQHGFDEHILSCSTCRARLSSEQEILKSYRSVVLEKSPEFVLSESLGEPMPARLSILTWLAKPGVRYPLTACCVLVIVLNIFGAFDPADVDPHSDEETRHFLAGRGSIRADNVQDVFASFEPHIANSQDPDLRNEVLLQQARELFQLEEGKAAMKSILATRDSHSPELPRLWLALGDELAEQGRQTESTWVYSVSMSQFEELRDEVKSRLEAYRPETRFAALEALQALGYNE